MSAKLPPSVCQIVPMEQLAATAQMLADELAAAAQRSNPAAQRHPPLHLVGANDHETSGKAMLSARTRCYLRARRVREGLFPESIFADPAWDMLLDLFASKLEGTEVCVSDACSAAGVPPTTALRWLCRLEDSGLLVRRSDPKDSRRIHVELTAIAVWRVELWLKTTFCAGPVE